MLWLRTGLLCALTPAEIENASAEEMELKRVKECANRRSESV